MNPHIRTLRLGMVALTLLTALTCAAPAGAQAVTPNDETVSSVRRMLERLPYYGVFDFIVFRVDRVSSEI